MAILVRSMPLHTIVTKAAVPAPKLILFFFSQVNHFPLTSHLQNPTFTSPISLRRRHFAVKSGRSFPDSNPKPEPPIGTGFEASLGKFKDRVQIFFAVLVWMSLFFWTCASDDRNRPNRR